MSYEIHIIRSAEKEFDRLGGTVQKRIIKKISSLEENPRPKGAHKLSGREEYRIRVGVYRILYIINDENHVITIVAIGHRREIYN